MIATSITHSVVSVEHAGAWAPLGAAVPVATQLAAYVDVYGQLSAFWIGVGDDLGKSHYLRTLDGSAAEMHDVLGWVPLYYGELFSPAGAVLVGRTEEGTSAAYFDPDAFDWYPWLPPRRSTRPPPPRSRGVRSCSSASGPRIVHRGGSVPLLAGHRVEQAHPGPRGRRRHLQPGDPRRCPPDPSPQIIPKISLKAA